MSAGTEERLRQLQERLLEHLQTADLHRWPGTDGMTVADLLLSYPPAMRAGRVPDHRELLHRHPELANELRSFFGGPAES
jgi:hypothetical protein